MNSKNAERMKGGIELAAKKRREKEERLLLAVRTQREDVTLCKNARMKGEMELAKRTLKE